MLQFPAGYHVESAAQACEHFQNRQIAVRFHRKAQGMRLCAKASLELGESVFNRSAAIEISRRTELQRRRG